MKFCPICGKTYEAEIEQATCPVCGQELLNGTYEESFLIFSSDKEELILRLYNYLCESGFQNTGYYYDKEKGIYNLLCSSEKAQKVITYLMEVTQYEEISGISKTEQEHLYDHLLSLVPEEMADAGGKTYINPRERYDDMMSSANSLLIVGTCGFIFELLIYSGIIPLKMNILFYVLSSAMFLFFLSLGFLSLSRAKAIKGTISTEETLAEQIKEFLLHTYTPLSSSETDHELPEELYYMRTADMTEKINAHFPKADELLVENAIEEVYNELYPSDTETEG